MLCTSLRRHQPRPNPELHLMTPIDPSTIRLRTTRRSNEADPVVVSTEFPVFEIDQKKVFPEVVDVDFRTPSVWPALSGASTGTNVRRKRLNPADFLKYQMPLPSRETQAKLREIYSQNQTISEGRKTTAQELDALLPAILLQAFNGDV